MTSKNIYILNGHPAEASLNHTLAETYADASREAGHEVRLTNIRNLEFDPDYGFGGYTNYKPLEADLEKVLEDIQWSNHVVLTTPLWWGGMPAKLKGLFDRTFLPGRTYDTRNPKWNGFPAPMLSGRTGRIFITSDTPAWYLRWIYGNPMPTQVKRQIFEFVGIKPARVTHFSAASHPKPGAVKHWTEVTKKLGAAAK